jgi:hypothetical protein
MATKEGLLKCSCGEPWQATYHRAALRTVAMARHEKVAPLGSTIPVMQVIKLVQLCV